MSFGLIFTFYLYADAPFVSAATYVASVLEHAGYIYQSIFIRDFLQNGFFRDAGALVFLIGGVGAVVSIAMYGSYRAARFLVIGPVLYWFMIGPTVETQGVVWKIGDSQILTPDNQEGLEAAKEARRKLLAELNIDDNGNVKVAKAFWLYAYPINEFVKEFVARMLLSEDKDARFTFARTRGLEMLFQKLPDNSMAVELIEGPFMTNCSGMFTNAAVGAQAFFRQIAQDRVGSGPKTTETRKEALRQHFIQQTEASAVSTKVSTSGILSQWIDRSYRLATMPDSPPLAKNTVAKNMVWQDGMPLEAITCGQVWQIVAEELWKNAALEYSRLLGTMTDSGKNQDTLEACGLLREKLFQLEEGTTVIGQNCESAVTAGLALSMLANQVKRADTFGRVVRRFGNEGDMMNPRRNTAFVVSGIPRGYKLDTASPGWKQIQKIPVEGTDQTMSITSLRFKGPGDSITWQPMVRISDLKGMDYASWIATARFETLEMRQRIFTAALQMPYYQGVILFILAVSYPFLSLVVLLPGRAHNVLNLPLAWLWVKSWDIGFAAVMILDKVLYNMLPSMELPVKIMNGPWRNVSDLPLVLSEAFKFDPTMNTHIIYLIISMVMFSIPAVTGAIFLKARRGVFDVWTSAIKSEAGDAGKRMSTSWSYVHQNEPVLANKSIGALARRYGNLGSGSIMDGAAARFWGGVGFAGALYGTDFKGKKTEAVLKGVDAWLDHGSRAGIADANFKAAVRESFDPVLGRFGVYQMMNNAYNAAVTGKDTFEITHRGFSAASEAYLGLALTRTNTAMSVGQKIIGTTFGKLSFTKGSLASFNEMLFVGTLASQTPELLNWFSKGEGDPNDALRGLKNVLDLSGASNAEFMSEVFGVQPWLINKVNEEGTEDENRSAFIDQFFQIAGDEGGSAVPPGGSSGGLGGLSTWLTSEGHRRSTGRAGAGGGGGFAQGAVDQAAEFVGEAYGFDRTDFSGAVFRSGKGDDAKELSAELGVVQSYVRSLGSDPNSIATVSMAGATAASLNNYYGTEGLTSREIILQYADPSRVEDKGQKIQRSWQDNLDWSYDGMLGPDEELKRIVEMAEDPAGHQAELGFSKEEQVDLTLGLMFEGWLNRRQNAIGEQLERQYNQDPAETGLYLWRPRQIIR